MAVIGLWLALLAYVFIAIRKIMAANGRRNAQTGLPLPTGVSERAVLVNRVALVVVGAGSTWLLARYLP
jgi:hypothetical protein